MSAFQRKYATATHIYVPIIKRGVVDFAVGADWSPAAGDVKISIDGGAAANVTNLPSAIAMGNTAMWDFSLTSAELTGKKILITVADASTKAVEDQFIAIETYGHASAEVVFDLSQATPAVNVTQYGGSAGTFASGRPEVNVSHYGGVAIATANVRANVVQYGGSNGTFASGRPEVNVSHIAGTAQTAVDAGARLDATVSSRATPAQVNAEVLDVLNVDTFAEPTAVPAATCTLIERLQWLFSMARNKITQTDALTSLRNDGDTNDIATSATSDDGTTATRGKYS